MISILELEIFYTTVCFMKTSIITIISAILGIICLPFLSVIAVACWLNSWFISWTLKPLGLEKMEKMDAYMAQYPDMIVSFQFFLSGLPDIDLIRLTTWQKIVQALDENGNLRFEKFSQVMEKYYGLWFWCKAAKVHPQNHIHMYKGHVPSNESELKKVIAQLNNVPLRCDIPQWQIILIPLQGDFLMYGLPSCVLIRKHHSIADGYSFMKLVALHFGDQKLEFQPKNALGNAEEPSKIHKMFMVVFAVCSLFRIWVEGRITERNILHGHPLNNKDFVTWAVFDLEAVKAIKNATKTTPTNVLLSCLSAAIRKHLISKNVSVPKTVACMIPMGKYKPNDEFKLQNDIITGRLCLPVGLDDPFERLRNISKSFEELKSSPDIVAVELAIQFIMPYFPRQLLDWLVTNVKCITIGTSSLAGLSNDNFKLFGQDVILPLFYQPHFEDIGINISFFGQMDKLYVGVISDTSVMKSQEELDEIIISIRQELEQLHKTLFPRLKKSLQFPLSQLERKTLRNYSKCNVGL